MDVKQQTGLTLVEVMMAVAIMAIIAAIAVPVYQDYIGEARYGAAIQDMGQMRIVFDDLAADEELRSMDSDSTAVRGIYSDAAGLIVLGDVATTPAGTTAWNDPWGNVFRYQRANSVLQDYVLRSSGPDGTAGNADDAVIQGPE